MLQADVHTLLRGRDTSRGNLQAGTGCGWGEWCADGQSEGGSNRLRSACGCLKLRTRDLKPDENADSDSCDSVSIQDFQTTDLFSFPPVLCDGHITGKE